MAFLSEAEVEATLLAQLCTREWEENTETKELNDESENDWQIVFRERLEQAV